MAFDFVKVVSQIERKSPTISKHLSMGFLSLASPFNSHLKLKMLNWDQRWIQLRLKNHRKVRNHVGSIHAGALFTLGETCAGLLIVRNFSFKEFRPIMSKISAEFFKQAKSTVTGEAVLESMKVNEIKYGLDRGHEQFIDMQTQIKRESGELIALVNTTWQIKSWDKVRT